jgi:hypothetical protein
MDNETTVTIRQYRLLPPLDWSEDCEAEMRRMTALWNKLVEIDRSHTERYRAATADDPAVAELRTQYETLSAEIEALIEAKKAARARARARAETPELDDKIKVLKAQRKPVAGALKEATKEARARAKPVLDALEAERKAAVKLARQPAQSGLYWGNYNAVCASYDTARAKILNSGGEMHFRHHDGSGRLVNQIQGGVSVEELFASAKSQASIAERESQPRTAKNGKPIGPGNARHTLTMTVYRTSRTSEGNRTVTWPMVMHRPLPDGAVIQEVHVHRRRIEARWVWTVTFLCRIPAAEVAAPSGSVTAVDLGWRKTNEGLRVATVMREGTEEREYTVLPNDVLEALERPERIRGHRDTALNTFDARTFLGGIDWAGAPPELQAIADRLRKAPKISAARLASLAIAWRLHLDYRPDDFSRLEAWRKRDKHLWIYECNLRDQAQKRRLDFYRHAAAQIVDGASAIVLEEFDLAQAARTEGRDNLPHAAARHQRQMAAVHTLRTWIETYTTRRGIPIHRHRGVSTRQCSECGERLDPPKPEGLIYTCTHCGHASDQDVQACRNMIAAYRAGQDASAEMAVESKEALAVPDHLQNRHICHRESAGSAGHRDGEIG